MSASAHGCSGFSSVPSSYCSTSSAPYQIRDSSSSASSVLSTTASVITKHHRHNHNQNHIIYLSKNHNHQQHSHHQDGEAVCAVCGDGPAKLHYGVLACYGCKGFFRRTLSGKYHYICRFDNDCIVDKYQRNSCRCCRFKRCIEVGMDPKAVRPDRDLTGKQRVPRLRKRALDEELINHMVRLQGNDWSRKIPVEARMLLMQLMNIESKVAKGDCAMEDRRLGGGTVAGFGHQPTKSTSTTTAQHHQHHQHQQHQNHQQQPPLPSDPTTPTGAYSGGGGGKEAATKRELSLRELFEQRPSLNTRRTEMCYEPYRMAQAEELPKIAHRGAIAAVDWVESLAELFDTMVLNTQDKVALVKAGYAPLTIFNFSARTAQNTRNPDILCLCSYSYVPRKLPSDFTGHLSNNLIDRTLNELVGPLRRLALREEEVVPLKAIILLDPNARNLSPEAQRGVAQLRDRVQDMLFNVVKELHPVPNAAQRFGNLLLLLPTISTLSGVMCENMQFCQVFGWTDPLLNELFETDSTTDKCHAGGGELSDCLFGSTASLMSNSPPVLGTSDATHTIAAAMTPPPTFCNPADISLHCSPVFHASAHAPASAAASLSSTSVPHSPSSVSNSPSSSSSSIRTTTVNSLNMLDSYNNSSNRMLRCEMSTQTEAGTGEEAVLLGTSIAMAGTSSSRTTTTTALALSSYHHDQQQQNVLRNDPHHQQHIDHPIASYHHQQQQDDIGVVSPASAEDDDDDRDAMLSPLGVLFDDAELDSLCRDHDGQPVTFDPLLFEHAAAIAASSSSSAIVDDHQHHQIDDDDLFRLMQ